MANALVIRKGTILAKCKTALRAAQYVRMSTDYQRYSIQNQAAAIAAFAQQKSLTIVRTYIDEGRSGLRIKGRPGLIQLMDDVRSGEADFEHILVYDVSRWGRFQDVDESAHHEFVCKQSGIKVTYCAEQFDNDGTLLSSIVKNIKRVMAAEFSRELSVKVHAGQSRVASLGFRVGGPLTFGLRRELIGENRRSRGWLGKGERKSLQTDRVQLGVGSEEEAAVVRSIFHRFVIERKSDVEIARQLNRANVVSHHERPWTGCMIHNILRNENYVGHVVYNRTSRRLGQKLVKNPVDRWVRSNVVLDPIIDPKLFARAQEIMDHRYVSLSEDEMLLHLRLLLKRKGMLTTSIVDNSEGVPSATSYVKHFGSLRRAFARIGYVSPRDCAWIDSREYWSEVLESHARYIAEALTTKRLAARADGKRARVTVNGKSQIWLQIARQLKKREANHAAAWRVHRKSGRSGLLLVLRLDDTNEAIADYLVMPAKMLTKPYISFPFRPCREEVSIFDRKADLIAGIKRRLERSSSGLMH